MLLAPSIAHNVVKEHRYSSVMDRKPLSTLPEMAMVVWNMLVYRQVLSDVLEVFLRPGQ
jgi:hypothetical protein